jgi:hypothetical protein
VCQQATMQDLGTARLHILSLMFKLQKRKSM